jgi:hypothetical protein
MSYMAHSDHFAITSGDKSTTMRKILALFAAQLARSNAASGRQRWLTRR